jgi:uncharacterized membrane protein
MGLRPALLLASLLIVGCRDNPPSIPSVNEADATNLDDSVQRPAESNNAKDYQRPPAPPMPPPVAAGYRAVGNEPGWMLTIDESQLSYLGDYGEVRITQPKPEPMIGIAGETYRTPRLTVNIVHGGRCSDGMSDYVYADKVQVTADGKQVEGCGGERTLPPGGSPP